MTSYIRLWAPTDGSAAAADALAYARAMLRFAPVRLISLTGRLDGPGWGTMATLLTTPMRGDMINVVCGPPEYWVKSLTVAMPERDVMHESLAAGETRPVKTKSEVMERELWTSLAARNVLIATGLPQTDRQAVTANRYDAIITPSADVALPWSMRFATLRMDSRVLPAIVTLPITSGARVFRDLVLGAS
jgi:hypothetical protein